MARAPFNAMVFPYWPSDRHVEYAIFKRGDTDEDFWQGITGGGEDSETPMETAIRETWEESHIARDSQFIRLDTFFAVPVTYFGGGRLWGGDTYVIPVHCFGVRATSREIRLSHEHTEFRWLTFRDAVELVKFDNAKIALWELDQRVSENPESTRMYFQN